MVYSPPGSAVVANPGVETLLSQTSALNCYAKSVTLGGSEYIAISDGQHGQEVPLQLSYDASGNAQLDRVTQDGPGSSPDVANLIIPPVQMAGPTVTPIDLTITGIFPAFSNGSFFTVLGVFVTTSVLGIPIGSQVTISGGTPFDGTYTAAGYSNGSLVLPAFTPLGTPAYVPTPPAGTLSSTSTQPNVTMTRTGNTVQVNCAAPHNLKVGYLAQITDVPAAGSANDPVSPTGLGVPITSIGIDNEDFPGIATVTTTTPHGLAPQSNVSITGVEGVAIGGSVSASRQGGIVQFTTATPHGLVPGAGFSTSGFSDATFNFSSSVVQVVDPLNFTTLQNEVTDATDSGGALDLNWPIPNTSTPQFFEVQTAPTPTTFTIQISWSDGTWASGQVSLPWNGTFYVLSIPTPTTFTYTQYGPQTFTTAVGTVSPYGQAAPGLHQMCVLFEDRQGGITSPSPPVKIEANGGQYLSVSNIPTGNSTCVSRILAFTGAGGSEFFYIPVPAQVNGQVVSTATVIDDNVTTSVVLDFGDPTLLEALGISIPGNDLANQIVLDSALFFGSFEERLVTFGQRNRIQSGEGTGGFLNLGFDGGQLPGLPGIPTGWTGTSGGALFPSENLVPPRPAGFVWRISVAPTGNPSGLLTQPAYEDIFGDPIISGNTLYRIRVWLQPSDLGAGDVFAFNASLSSASTGFSSIATIPASQMSLAGSFLEAAFPDLTPQAVPPDLVLSIWASANTSAHTLNVDEFSVIYAEEPYLNDTGYGSYVQNAQGIDGVSGLFGTADNSAIFGMFLLRQGLRLLSKDPGGKLYAVSGTNNSEPSGWEVDEEAAMCGLVSPFALTVSQAADDSSSGGPEWAAWIANAGIQIFGGQEPLPISAEIQSDPNINPYGVPDFTSLNTAAQLSCWAVNDYRDFRKTIYFGIPIGGATRPNLILPLNYIGLSSAEQIADSPPVHLSLSGKMIARDLSRKWTRWRVPMNAAALMLRGVADLEPCFMGGATALGQAFGNAYTLNSALKTDDDYGLVAPYYTTTAVPTGDQVGEFQTGNLMQELAYLLSTVQWTGNLQIQIYVNYLNNLWPISLLLTAIPGFANDLEFGGGQATGRRFFLRYGSLPVSGTTDNGFNLTKVVAIVKQNARMPLTGAYK